MKGLSFAFPFVRMLCTAHVTFEVCLVQHVLFAPLAMSSSQKPGLEPAQKLLLCLFSMLSLSLVFIFYNLRCG